MFIDHCPRFLTVNRAEGFWKYLPYDDGIPEVDGGSMPIICTLPSARNIYNPIDPRVHESVHGKARNP
jgi:hypothetical protein